MTARTFWLVAVCLASLAPWSAVAAEPVGTEQPWLSPPGTPPPLPADAPAPPLPAPAALEEAKAHYRIGAGHFQAGAFDLAIAEYERAYALSQMPGLLYSLAVAHDSKGSRSVALDYYQRYLRAEPNGSVSGPVADRIAALARALAEEEAAQRAAQEAQARAEAERIAREAENQRAAEAYFKAGEEMLARGANENAIASFSQAYALVPSAAILLRRAQAHEAAGMWTLALSDYQSFARAEPKAPAVAAKVKEMERRIAAEEAARRAALERARVAAELKAEGERRAPRRKAGISLSTIGLAAGVGAGVLTGLSEKVNRDIRAGGFSSGHAINDANAAGKAYGKAAIGLGVVGGALLVVGLPLWFANLPPEDSPVALRASADGTGVALVFP